MKNLLEIYYENEKKKEECDRKWMAKILAQDLRLKRLAKGGGVGGDWEMMEDSNGGDWECAGDEEEMTEF